MMTPPAKLNPAELIIRITWPNTVEDQDACQAELTRRGLWLSPAQTIAARRRRKVLEAT